MLTRKVDTRPGQHLFHCGARRASRTSERRLPYSRARAHAPTALTSSGRNGADNLSYDTLHLQLPRFICLDRPAFISITFHTNKQKINDTLF